MQNINYDVLNSLNLMSKSLGDAYLTEGYNPFDEDYVMDFENTSKILKNIQQKENVEFEPFLEASDKDIIESFENSLENNNLVLAEVSQMPSSKKQKEIKVFLKNRSKLLAEAIEKLKNGDSLAFELYKELAGLDVEYSKYLKKSFYKDFDLNVVIQNFLSIINLQVQRKAPQKQQTAKKVQKVESIKEQVAPKTNRPQPPRPKPKKVVKENGMEL